MTIFIVGHFESAIYLFDTIDNRLLFAQLAIRVITKPIFLYPIWKMGPGVKTGKIFLIKILLMKVNPSKLYLISKNYINYLHVFICLFASSRGQPY